MHHLTTVTIPRLASSNTLPTEPTAAPKIDVVVGLDARGFLLGPILAMRLGAAFVPVRKKGKLPGDVKVVSYEKEYGVVSATTRCLGSTQQVLIFHVLGRV